jgi:hypothetical protein
MRVYFQAFWQFEQLREVLQSDGWALEPQAANTFLAEHPEAPDETAARCRLSRLGLLISRSFRIEFRPSHPQPRGTLAAPGAALRSGQP